MMEPEKTKKEENIVCQAEMSGYLKAITIGVGVFLLCFIFWFLPLVLQKPLMEAAGENGYQGTCALIWISAVPAAMCLIRFWGICESIRQDRSFCEANAWRLKRMSQYMLLDTALYSGFLVWFFVSGWYAGIVWLVFPILLAVFISVSLTVLCAALSHLVRKASEMQTEQDLTI